MKPHDSFSKLILILAFSFSVAACGTSAQQDDDPTLSDFKSLRVYGTSLISQGTSSYQVEISPDGMFSSDTTISQGDVIVSTDSWTKKLSDRDLSDLRNLIVKANLEKQKDIMGEGLCLGANPMTVEFVSIDKKENEFDIDPCLKDSLPAAVKAVLQKVTELGAKYSSSFLYKQLSYAHSDYSYVAIKLLENGDFQVKAGDDAGHSEQALVTTSDKTHHDFLTQLFSGTLPLGGSCSQATYALWDENEQSHNICNADTEQAVGKMISTALNRD